MSRGNSSNSGFFNATNLTIAIIAMLASVGSFVFAVWAGWIPEMFGKKDRFTCELRADPSRGGEVWTVVYRNDKGQQPWLKMVTTFGDDWPPQKRCNIVAERLETYRKDGLIKLTYRSDPSTAKQFVICAKTKLSGDNCPLLVTLKPNTDPYLALRAITESLISGGGVEQSSSNETVSSSFSQVSPEINLMEHLSDEDLNTGKTNN